MLAPGTQFGRYEIQRKLGRGGMGTVYVAHDPVLGRMVAIKVFLTDLDLPDAAERFTREARAAAALNHANIVTIYDFGDYDSRPYIAMEYVQGETVAEIIKRKASVSLTDKLRWMEELCAGAAYAHRIGVIHRDIKPMNLMIDRTGRLKILDFGIAKMIGAFASKATASVGTPGYMAPEQILSGAVDSRSDVFSIGVVCYELLAYTEAFPGENTVAITHRILSEDVRPLSGFISGISPDLVACVEQALKKSPGDRFDDADGLRLGLARARRESENEGGVDVAPTVLSPRPPVVGTRPPTGPENAQVSDRPAVSALTPPPDLQRPDREALTRRRTAQIEAALERSRAALHQGDLEVADDECLQALTLDDTHPAALELKALIQVATAKRKAVALVGEARDELGRGSLTGVQHLLQQARSLDPDALEVKRLERDLRLARVEQERLRQRAEAARTAAQAAEQALLRGDLEPALALARQALDLEPDLETARAIVTEAMRRLDEEAGVEPLAAANAATVIAPSTAGRPAVVPVPSTVPRTDYVAAARAFVASVRDVLARQSWITPEPWLKARRLITSRPRKQQRIIAAAAAGVVAIVLVVAVVSLIPPAPAPTGAVFVDAVPFAVVTGIEAADGTRPAFAAGASTPLSLTLPVGTYRIRLEGPPPENEARVVTVQVQATGVAAPPLEKFQILTPEQYFTPYLSAPVEPSPEGQPGQAEPGASGASANAVPQGASR